MGAMGKYISILDDAGRDRLINATGWTATLWEKASTGERCLIGHGHDLCAAKGFWIPEVHAHTLKNMPVAEIYTAFDRAYNKRGYRVVRAIKLRAAKLNGSSAEDIMAIINVEAAAHASS